ncbi:MAG: hypothetical protein DYH13_02900 [Alphaproteobacteria bacterium PRO2]|nr:hypothetical protein [Alphaproteobacteria bacterium PRO2]
MKLFASFIMGMAVLMAGSFVYAEDEFGERFHNENPVALKDKSAPAEPVKPENIEPAAGEEEPDTTGTEPAASDKVGTEPAAGHEAGTIEGELEQKFGTEVTSTINDKGDGQTEQHDSVGEGKIRAFYKSEQDGRVMDTEDAAGVEVKVIEFE